MAANIYIEPFILMHNIDCNMHFKYVVTELKSLRLNCKRYDSFSLIQII